MNKDILIKKDEIDYMKNELLSEIGIDISNDNKIVQNEIHNIIK